MSDMSLQAAFSDLSQTIARSGLLERLQTLLGVQLSTQFVQRYTTTADANPSHLSPLLADELVAVLAVVKPMHIFSLHEGYTLLTLAARTSGEASCVLYTQAEEKFSTALSLYSAEPIAHSSYASSLINVATHKAFAGAVSIARRLLLKACSHFQSCWFVMQHMPIAHKILYSWAEGIRQLALLTVSPSYVNFITQNAHYH